ncbi:cell division protein ZapE [Arthrobacter sp. I2-34]|uniref:Cell division protein ZapE n=1 Tax=Arthrobacter hankyongi TaxID=2904801 RepID=A0ABS9L7L8_9MICC|nr:cell division protein ZapE [Arthrobacter hankyongi]MCG2622492.1 cell division protein ZapE [Arthrobacter hankyongi]
MPRSDRIRLQLAEAIARDARHAGFELGGPQLVVRDRMLQLGAELVGRRAAPPRSLYVWGKAGRGKSWLLDAFFRALPVEQKRRVHFHGFFEALHRRIHEHRTRPDAVNRAVDGLVGGARVLCFDEFHVHDPADAALLARLLRRLFDSGVVLLASSNYAPSALLPDPMWHHLFEPGIELITRNMDVLELAGETDYRTAAGGAETGFAGGAWLAAGDEADLPDGPFRRPGATEARTLAVGSRDFAVSAVRGSELWISFGQLCQAPTSRAEYLAWARRFSRWFITDVPGFADVGREARQRFIGVLDILCDADIQVFLFSDLDRQAFCDSAADGRPDAFRMVSRLRLLREPARR